MRSPCRPAIAIPSPIAARCVPAALAIALFGVACGPPEHTTGPELGPEAGFVVMEGDPDWHTDSVS